MKTKREKKNDLLFQKYLVINNPSLAYMDENSKQKIFEDDCQFLYMFPLNIIDYVKAYEDNHLCKLVVKNFTIKNLCNIKKYLSLYSNNSNYNKCIELEISEDFYSNDDFNDFLKLIKKKNIISIMNIKNGSKLNLSRKDIKLINYFKFSIDNCSKFEEIYGEFFIENFDLLKNTTIQFKIYLSLEEIGKYEMFVDKYKDLCDFILFTKRLIGENENNVKLSKDISFKLHSIKQRFYCDSLVIKVVKNLSTLYYDMFLKDQRNSKLCYAHRVCKYLIEGKIYPCATKQIINDDMNMSNPCLENYILNLCGDCASLFENDFLNKIFHTKYTTLFFKEKSDLDTIYPVGIGTFKLNNCENLKYGIMLGQNLVDCNLVYRNEVSLEFVSKNINVVDRSKLFLYCKLYRQIETIQDIEDQINEYLNLFNTKYLDIVTIHSLDIIGKIDLIDIYNHLETLKKKGIIRHIGICNVSFHQLRYLIENNINVESFEGVFSYYCKYYEDVGLLDYCKNNNIKFFAYQTLLMGNFSEDDLLKNLAIKYKKTIVQILINYYIIHKKVVPIIKATELNHIYENLTYDFYISKEDYLLLDKMNKNKKYEVEFVKGSKNKIYQLSYNLKN